jgi:tRNA threonylcarbamoyladenosine biosynthesis protein TsaB
MRSGPLLAIDAATYRGTAAIVDGDRVLAETETQMRGVHEERLMPAVAAVLRDAGVDCADLGGVVCGSGPGSFTSLRIAASIAKGIVTAVEVPLYAVSSLLLTVAGARPALGEGDYLALLDAMRGDWFVARISVDAAGTISLVERLELLDAPTAERMARAEKRAKVGPGQGIDASPHARGLARLSEHSDAVEHVDPSTWEPSYGRLAEAQVRWEQSHGRALGT